MVANSNRTARVWRSIKDNDVDSNGFLSVEELENCFREHFAPELEGKSVVYFFRQFSADHDKDFVNYRKVKDKIIQKIDSLRNET